MKEIRDGDDEVAKILLDWSDTRMSMDGRFASASMSAISTDDEDYDYFEGDFVEDGINTMYTTIDRQCYYMQRELTPEIIEAKVQASFLNGEYSFLYATLIAIDLSDHYEDFTYDEERGLYRYEAPANSKGIKVDFIAFEGMGNHLDRVELKFKEGRLAYVHWMNYSTTPEGERMVSNDIRDCYYDYGKTKVVAPENALPYPMEG